MNAEPRPRQTSLRAFFGFLTLACILLGVIRCMAVPRDDRAASFWIFWFLLIVTPISIGAAVGSLFGSPVGGAIIVLMIEVAVCCGVLAYAYSWGLTPFDMWMILKNGGGT
jgi:hypothetical protein